VDGIIAPKFLHVKSDFKKM